MRGVVLAFRKARVLVLLYALLNASVIVANNSLDCLLFTFVQLPATYYFRIKKAKTRAIKVRVLLFGGDAGSWTPVLKAFTVTFYMLISRLDFSHFGTWAGLRLMSPKWQPTYRTLGWRCLFFWCRLPREQKTLGRHADLNYAARAKPILDFIVLFFAFNFSVSVLTQTSLRHAYPDSNQ